MRGRGGKMHQRNHGEPMQNWGDTMRVDNCEDCESYVEMENGVVICNYGDKKIPIDEADGPCSSGWLKKPFG